MQLKLTKQIVKVCSIGVFCLSMSFDSRARQQNNWYAVYFTHRTLRSNAVGPEQALVKLITNTRQSFYGSFYELTSRKVIGALINARRRGVEVKLVVDDNTFHNQETYCLIKAGVPVVTDERNNLMHNKFAIIDKMVVWTGSYNATANGSKNNNNAIVVRSKACAQIYLNEFNEQFNHHVFGNNRDYEPFATMMQRSYVRIEDTDVHIYFSPEQPVESILAGLLGKARYSIDFMAFSFTSDRLGELLIDKNKQGIVVRGLFEHKGIGSEFSQYYKMKVEGLKVKYDRKRYLMHHKVFIIDGETVITGSYNFSKNASQSNDENILIIKNKFVAQQYLAEFKRLYR